MIIDHAIEDLMMMRETVFIFAYGPNMLEHAVQETAPSARSVGMARLKGYEIRWHTISADGSGKCNIAFSRNEEAEVYGIVYEIPAIEKAMLDRVEALGGYRERQVVVELDGLGPKMEMAVSVYCAGQVNQRLRPYAWYKDMVVDGARQRGLPDSYVSALVAVEAIDDRRPGRSAGQRLSAGC